MEMHGVKVFDIDSVTRRINTLKTVHEQLRDYGDKIQDKDIVVPIYELTIGYLDSLVENIHLIKPYSNAYRKRFRKIIDIDNYKAGMNMFIDQCIKAAAETENIIRNAK